MPTPSWLDFSDRPATGVEAIAPAEELASVLRHYREDMDAAARASIEGRARSLRALADQAALVAELERLLDLRPASATGIESHNALWRLKEQMLEGIRAAGLEVVRLVGVEAHIATALADVEAWHYDDALPGEIVLEQIEAAVLHHGTPLRRGRVVMGAPRGGRPIRTHVAPRLPQDPPVQAGPEVAPVIEGARIVCPVPDCATLNEPDTELCVACLTHLGGYVRLSLFPRRLFNRGLVAARAGDSRLARDCFAAVALWHPDDLESHNAYALACLESRDFETAEQTWDRVLARAPSDPVASAGLRALRGRSEPAAAD